MFLGSVNSVTCPVSSPALFINDIIDKGTNGEKQLLIAPTLGHALLQGEQQLDESNVTLLDVIRNGSIPQIKSFLIKDNIDVNQRDDTTGVTPLMIASLTGQHETIKRLMRKWADPLISDNKQLNSFHYSIFGKNIKCVKMLLTGGDILNSRDEYGRTPLMIAAHMGDVPILQLLVKKGASLLERDNCGRNILHWAVTANNVSLLEVLFSKYDMRDCLNEADNEGATPLHYTTLLGGTVLEYLLSKGCNPCITDTNGLTVIHWACAIDSLSQVKLLLKYNRELLDLTSIKSPLHIAATVGADTISTTLIEEYGTNVNIEDSSSMTPLHYSSQYGHYECAKLLLNHDANIEATTIDNNITSLHIASEQGHTDIVKELLVRGAKRNRPTQRDNRNCAVHLAATEGREKVLVLLINDGCPVDSSRDSDGCTPLHLAAGRGHLDCCKYLLSKGANMNAKETIKSMTPLDMALTDQHTLCINHFISLGAHTGGGVVHNAVVTIQRSWKRYVHKRRQAVTHDWAARRLQYYIGIWLTKRRQDRIRKRRQEEEHKAAIVIQRQWIRYVTVKREMEESYCVLKSKLTNEYMATQLILSQLEETTSNIHLPPIASSNLFKIQSPPLYPIHHSKTKLKPLPRVKTVPVARETPKDNRVTHLHTAPHTVIVPPNNPKLPIVSSTHTNSTRTTNNTKIHTGNTRTSAASISSNSKTPGTTSNAKTFRITSNTKTHFGNSDSTTCQPSSTVHGITQETTESNFKLPLLTACHSTSPPPPPSLSTAPVINTTKLPQIPSNTTSGSGGGAVKARKGRVKGSSSHTKKEESKPKSVDESLIYNHAERYRQLQQVMELLQEAKEKKSHHSSTDSKDYKELKIQIQSALEEAIRLRADTETLSRIPT